MAQLVARLTGGQEAAGSSPVTRTTLGSEFPRFRGNSELFLSVQFPAMRISNGFLTSSEYTSGEPVGEFLLSRCIKVSVNVRSHLDVRMSEIFLNVLERKAVRQEQTRTAMPLWYIKTNPEKSRNTKGFEGI